MTKAGNPPPQKKEMIVKRIHFTDKTSHKREEEKYAFSIFCNPVSFELCGAPFSYVFSVVSNTL